MYVILGPLLRTIGFRKMLSLNSLPFWGIVSYSIFVYQLFTENIKNWMYRVSTDLEILNEIIILKQEAIGKNS